MGFGGKRLLQLIIKYVPKYVLFYRNMKTVIVIKTLRQIHFARKIARNLTSKDEEEDDEDEIARQAQWEVKQAEKLYTSMRSDLP